MNIHTMQDLDQVSDLWSPAFIALLVVNSLLCFGFYMLPATLPAYVSQLGGSSFQTSLVIGAFSATSLLARIFSGTLVDTVGEKKVILAGILVIVATTLSFAWLPVTAILLLRSVQGVGWGVATAAVATAVYRIVPESRRGEGTGYYTLTVILPVSLAPMLAIVLMNAFSYEVVLLLSAGLCLASLTQLQRGLASLATPTVDARHRRALTWQNIFERGALMPSALCFLVTVPVSSVVAYLVLFGQQQHIDNIWVFFIGYTAMIFFTRPFFGRLFDRKGHAFAILPGCVLMATGLLVLSVTHTTPLLITASLLYGLGYGAVQPSLQTLAINRCPPDRKAAANGLFLSAIDLGYIVGAVSLGYLASHHGYAVMYRYATLALLIFLLVYLLDWRRHGATHHPSY